MAQTSTSAGALTASSPRVSNVARPASSLWGDAWRRLKRNRAALAGLTFIVALFFIAIFADVLAPYNYTAQNTKIANQAPSAAHWFGTDELGRDLLTRLMRGARISLAVGIIVQALILLLGVPIGAIAGYFGGKSTIC